MPDDTSIIIIIFVEEIQRHFVDAQARLPATVPKGAVASS